MKEALKLALEAYLCREMPAGTVIGDPKWWVPRIANAIKEALSSPNGEAQPAVALEQRSVRTSVDSEHLEPVGEAHLMQEGFTHCIWSEDAIPVGTKLYTTPPQRKCENCGEFGTCCLHDAQNKENT